MEGNNALRLIKRADYCALTSLDTGLDVAHVVYSIDIIANGTGLETDDVMRLTSVTGVRFLDSVRESSMCTAN